MQPAGQAGHAGRDADGSAHWSWWRRLLIVLLVATAAMAAILLAGDALLSSRAHPVPPPLVVIEASAFVLAVAAILAELRTAYRAWWLAVGSGVAVCLTVVGVPLGLSLILLAVVTRHEGRPSPSLAPSDPVPESVRTPPAWAQVVNREAVPAFHTSLGPGRAFLMVAEAAIAWYVGVFAIVAAGILGDWLGGPAFHSQLFSVLGPIGTVWILGGAIVWVYFYRRYTVAFFSANLEVGDGLAKTDLPRVVLAAEGVIAGEPDLRVKMRARYLGGDLGRCWIEFFASGVQISKLPRQREPVWQFAYEDVVQAEVDTMMPMGTRYSHLVSFLRVVTARPRMAFLFENGWGRERTMRLKDALYRFGAGGVRVFLD